MQLMLPEQNVEPESGRFPYQYALVNDQTKVHVYYHTGLDHALVEISGMGCKAITEGGGMDGLLVKVYDTATRIDVTVDIHTETSPMEFVGAGFNPRFTTHSRSVSATGESCYVGSMKSERHAVAYRYYAPHPRAHLLRIEHRFRRDHAKMMARYIVDHGINRAIAECGHVYQWRHADWRPEDIARVPLPKVEVDMRNAGLVQWLLKQVFPAMRKAERQGTIEDLRAFVQLYLFDDDGSLDID